MPHKNSHDKGLFSKTGATAKNRHDMGVVSKIDNLPVCSGHDMGGFNKLAQCLKSGFHGVISKSAFMLAFTLVGADNNRACLGKALIGSADNPYWCPHCAAVRCICKPEANKFR